MITREMFKEATGIEPSNDDLERCNCQKTEPEHTLCGWNHKENKPVFMVGHISHIDEIIPNPI